MIETAWKDDGLGVTQAGDVGGEIQVGEAYSRRFVHSRLAGRAITVEAYGVQGDATTPDIPEGVIRLQVRTELVVATDPDDLGGTEVWSDYEYSDLPEHFDVDYTSVEAAETAARIYLRQLDPALHFNWDGKPEMGPASVLKYGELIGKLAHQFSEELLGEHHSVAAYVQNLAFTNNAHEHNTIELDYWYETVVDREGNAWRVAWLMDTTRCLKSEDEEGGWVFGVYWEPFAPAHTHYDAYRAPFQVPGRLSDCIDVSAHDPRGSELWADYRYDPHLVPSSVTGLPGHMERDLLAAYLENKQDDIRYAITDVTPDEEYTYRVKIANRTMYALNDTGPVFHTEEWGLYPDGFWHGIPVNPHPPYEHMPAFCPNCGY
jgi:hypothetical protein